MSPLKYDVIQECIQFKSLMSHNVYSYSFPLAVILVW